MSISRERASRVLYIAPYVPSLIRVRGYQVLRHLAQTGHRVTVAALDDGFADEAVRQELAGFCEAVRIISHPKLSAALRCVGALATETPLWVAHDRNPALGKAVREILAAERFDVAHVEHLRAAFIAPYLGDLPRIIDAVDCITKLRSGSRGGRRRYCRGHFRTTRRGVCGGESRTPTGLSRRLS